MTFSLKTLVRNATLLFAGEIANAALAFLSSIIVVRALGPVDYGAWAVVVSVATTVRAFLSFRIQEPLTRYLVLYRNSGDQQRLAALLGSSLIVEWAACLTSSVIVIFAAPAATMLTPGAGHIVLVYRIYALGLLFASLDRIFYCVARDLRRFDLLSVISPATTAAQCAVMGLLWLADLISLTSLAIVFATLSAVRFAVYGAYLRGAIRGYFRLPGLIPVLTAAMGSWRCLGPFWDFMRSTYIASSASSLAKNADIMLLAYFRPGAEVGWYRLAKSMISLMQTAGTSLTAVSYRDFVEHIAGDPTSLIARMKRLLRVMLPLVALATTAAMILSNPVIKIAYGDAFIPTAWLVNILMPGYALAFALFWAQPLLLSQGRHRQYLYSVTAWSIAIIIAAAYGGWNMGAIGVATAYSILWPANAIAQAVMALRFCLHRIKTTCGNDFSQDTVQ